MSILPLERKDMAFFLAVKPYMSPQAQQILDLILFFLNMTKKPMDLLDPIPVLSLLNLAKGLTQAPAPSPPPLEIPAAILPTGPMVTENSFAEGTADEEQRGEEQ